MIHLERRIPYRGKVAIFQSLPKGGDIKTRPYLMKLEGIFFLSIVFVLLLTHIPFKGLAEGQTALLGGHILAW